MTLLSFSFAVLLGFGLNISERIMTIVLSVVLGVFALALATLMFHRCKQRLQYVHQPLNNDMGKEFPITMTSLHY